MPWWFVFLFSWVFFKMAANIVCSQSYVLAAMVVCFTKSYSSAIVNMSASSVTQDSTRADASFSNHQKRTRQETHPTPIHNEVTNSAFPITEDTMAISVASEDALSNRIRDPTAIVGNRRPRRFTYGNEEGCSSSHIKDPL
nr:hypothetical protein [Tanacetum cinerariifolium]